LVVFKFLFHKAIVRKKEMRRLGYYRKEVTNQPFFISTIPKAFGRNLVFC